MNVEKLTQRVIFAWTPAVRAWHLAIQGILRSVMCLFLCPAQTLLRKRGGVQKSMGNKVPWKIGVLMYLPVTSRPLISLQKEAVLSPCNFVTTHLTACILNFYLPWTLRPMKRRTLSQRPICSLLKSRWSDKICTTIGPLMLERAFLPFLMLLPSHVDCPICSNRTPQSAS